MGDLNVSRYALIVALFAVGARATPQKTDVPVAQVSAKAAVAAIARAKSKLGTLRVVAEYRMHVADDSRDLRLYNEYRGTAWLQGYPNAKLRADLDPMCVIVGPSRKDPTYETSRTTVAFDGKIGTLVMHTEGEDPIAEVHPRQHRLSHVALAAGGWHFSMFGMLPTKLLEKDGVVAKVVQRDNKPYLEVRRSSKRAGFEGTYERWLLDPRHGYSPCLNELFVKGDRRRENEVSAFLSLGDGVWYPRRARSVDFRPDGTARRRQELQVTSAELLKDDPKLFDVVIPAGPVKVFLPSGNVTVEATGKTTRPADVMKRARGQDKRER